jgi:ornithine cyclodeaminase
MKIYNRPDIEAAVDPARAIDAVEEAFLMYSRGLVTVPPVGHLTFATPPGETHIKYGYRHRDSHFVIKVASGFYENPKLGLRSSSGLMLLFDATTGYPTALLLDDGYLTDLRTAAAGAVAAKYLAPKNVDAIGIVGAGIQAHLQLSVLRHVTSCRRAFVWARDQAKAAAFRVDGFAAEPLPSVASLARCCNLIVTTTPAQSPLVWSEAIRPGTHITAVGADSPGKQELDPELLRRADVLAVDARAQCFEYGDSAGALREGLVSRDRFVELGELIADPLLGRATDHQITIADLTGLAAQDIEIAKLAFHALSKG